MLYRSAQKNAMKQWMKQNQQIIKFDKQIDNNKQLQGLLKEMSNIEGVKGTSGKSTCIPSKYLTNQSYLNIQYDQFCYHPCQIARFIIEISHRQQLPKYSQYRLLKWIAYATFCQPVLITFAQKSVENILGNKSIFEIGSNAHMQDVFGENINIIMETLNVFTMIKGFSTELFNITKPPTMHNTLTYAMALWKNCLPILSKNRHYSACKKILEQTEQQSITQVKQFINEVYQLKEKVIKNLVLNNYYADNYKNTQQQQQPLLHQIDIELSKYNCLVSAEYLPDDYFNEYIEVWIDRTVQLNSLLGNFVCRERFGEFQYVKGPLTYAMEKGIMLVLNNFEHISNELLVGMRTLAQQMKIFHNQKTVEARGGFKILGLCSADKMSTKMRSMIANNQYIAHLDLPKRSVLNEVPKIEHKGNQQYIIQKLTNIENKMGLLASRKLWRRMLRMRKTLVQSDDHNKLWESFFTQGFKDSIELQITDLTSKIDQTRTIHHQMKYNKIIMGRATVDIAKQPSQKIVKTQYSLSILERLALCSQLSETPLLISQTGCGKTTLVQYLAELGGQRLYVYNMSSGTDVMDLVGGFKPIDCRSLLKQLFFRFIQKFRTVPGSQKNQQYLQELTKLYNEDQLRRLLPSLSASIVKIKSKVQDQRQLRQWDELKVKFDNINANLSKIDSNLVFSFLQGNLIKALKNGDWVLIDEINMATNDVLQKIVPLIEGKSLLLYEKGDLTYIERHQDFRIIACMNPANDSGKKPLPPNLMQKFTAINLPEPLRMDIQMMVKQIGPQLNPSEIADIYFDVKKQKTVSLRNLSRCLSYLNRNKQVYTFKRALYDALLLGFQHKTLLKKFQDLTAPKPISGFTQMHGFLVQTGSFKNEQQQIFHLTDTFLELLKDFLRAIAGTELPVLLEGPTSAGKTSIIRYVASVSGHRCIRINNHEHTEIQQYLGNYFPDKQGKLIFREGPLVQAVRQGHWLILDELNLARTQILECLNRLLDDNRELFIPEQQTHIKPHKNFRIFATQNPASYSGRKTLSRAFRNRFISLSFEDITVQDTMAIMKVRRPILNDSKQLAAYVKKTLQSLQNYRQRQRVFSKDGVITIRDLLKWTGRKFNDKQSFMKQGYALLAQRLRTQEEKKFVEGVLLAGTKHEHLDMYPQYDRVVNQYLNEQIISKSNIYVQMNSSFKRMAALTLKAAMNNQAVLLIGETGCGKTTLAELLASISGRKFYSINCHKHTQASDLLGSLRPCVKQKSANKFGYVNGVVIDAMLDGAVLLIDEINTAQDSVLERLNQVLESNNIGVQRGQGWQIITAKEGFCIIATMNPSGDYGKKELSPALRNRFTQIWVQPITHPQFIQQAENDIKQMITHKLSKPNDQSVYDNREQITNLVYKFLKEYNCIMAPKYGLVRKMLTMRDIGWICKFMCECSLANLQTWQDRYYWALKILAIEGVNFMMADMTDSLKLVNMKEQLIEYIEHQVPIQSRSAFQKTTHPQLQAISIVKQLAFPLLIKTDLPLELLGITPDERIFFSPHTQLTDLLGQFRPKGTDFIWQDQTLLKTVKNGERVALMDLNLAQQPVIEGINSLFDHRGSIFVVQLNEMFVKHSNFKPVVVLKQTAGNDRKGLPNSFLNRFIKIRVKDVSKQVKLKYLHQKFNNLETYSKTEKLWNYISKVLQSSPKTKIQTLQFVCELFGHGENYMAKAIQILQLPTFQTSQLGSLQVLGAEQSTLQLLPMAKKQWSGHKQTQVTLFSNSQQSVIQQVKSLIVSYITLNKSSFSVCLIGSVSDRDSMAQWVGYVVKKDVVKVILSTMTDMADMLGSYEQVDEDDNEVQMVQQMGDDMSETQMYQQCQQVVYKQISQITARYHKNRQQSINGNTNNSSRESRDSKNTITNFKYVESRIMRTLKQPQQQLLYIEVPNQAMLQRVQKGLKMVYEQAVNIVVGIDASIGGGNVCANTKFIPIHLSSSNTSNAKPAQIIELQGNGINNKQSTPPKYVKSEIMKQRVKYFRPNHSRLVYSDRQLRLNETVEWIKHNIEGQSNRNIIKAWQRLYQYIINTSSNPSTNASMDNQQQYAKQKQGKYKEVYKQQCTHIGLDKQYKTQIANIGNTGTHPCTYPQQYHTHIRQQLSLPLSRGHQELHESILQLFAHEVLDSRGTIIRDIDVRDNISEHDNDSAAESSKIIGHNQLDRGVYKDDMAYNATTAHKFQYLYVSESATTTGFRDQAKKLLSVCYNTHVHTQNYNNTDNMALTQYKTLMHKLKQQIEHMYTIATALYHKQILIKYSEEEYKIIPILSTANNELCRQSIFHYALANIPYSVNKLAGLQVDMSVIVSWDIEKSIIQYMGYLAVDVGQASKWLWNVRVRDLPVYQLIRTQVVDKKMDYFTNIAHSFIMAAKKDKKLMEILQTIIKNNSRNSNQMIEQQSEKANQDYISSSLPIKPVQFAKTLFNTFKPHYTNTYLNLTYHIETQAQLKTLLILSQQDKYYLQVYNQLCLLKYSGYVPNSYKSIQHRVTKYRQEYEQVQMKRYVYRGHDNLKLLKDFYQHLIRYCQAVEASDFNEHVIRDTLNELYRSYYHGFKDILWPIFVSFIIIHAEITKRKAHIANQQQSIAYNDKSLTQHLLADSNSTKSFQRAVELILQKQEQQFHDAAKDYTKFQRKFKNVIIDQYTQEGVNRNKENDEQQFKQFFGKTTQLHEAQKDTILDELYMLVRKRAGCKFELKLLKNIFNQCSQFYQFVVSFQLKFSNKGSTVVDKINTNTHINIYEQYSLPIVNKLSSPIPRILEQTKALLSKYNIDSVKIIGTLCNKIQEHKAHDQVYKILIDCQYLIDKVFELNSILPMAERINTQELVELCLRVRRIQLHNWKSMLEYKINRIEKSDTIEFIHFYRNFVQIGNIGESQAIQAKECFRMCDDFMRRSKISCYEYRLYLLGLICQNVAEDKIHIKHNINRIINFYASLREPIMQQWENVKKEKIREMAEYEKLSSWNSNQYLIFKATCEKFQRKVHHILKKYEEELSMQVGTLHANLRAKFVCQSLQQFGSSYKLKQQAQKMFELAEMSQTSKQNVNRFEGVVERIFESLQQIKQQHHNNQSKILLIRQNLAQLQQLAQDLPVVSSSSHNLQSNILSEEMFPGDHPQYYRKAVKYYFGMWDKLCLKTQTAWNREIVDRVWNITEKIWININSRIPKYQVHIEAELDEETDNLLILYEKFLSESDESESLKNNHHPIFLTELHKIKLFLRQKQIQFNERLQQKYTKIENPEQTLCLMKLGYIMSSIALNLQKNGLCAKENQQQGEQSGTQEVGDGVGIGQGQAHEGAQNVGDQIQFEEQVQGHKDEQQNKDANAGKKQQNDIQMQGDFEGDMYSKQQQPEGKDDQKEGEQKQADQKMGDVDNQQREQDIKNDKGRAEGSEQADVQIDGQEEGSEELVDNEQEQKEGRKGQERPQQSEQEGQQQKSDWDDNNEQGEQINKQKGAQLQEQQQGGDQDDDDRSAESISGKLQENEGSQEQVDQEGQQGQENQMEDQNQEQNDKSGQAMEQQINEQPLPEGEQEEKEKKSKKTRRTNVQAYGRQDRNSNNPLKNNQNEPQGQQKEEMGGQAEAQGAAEGEKGTGEPVHSLSAELLKQIQNLQRIAAKQNASFMKDLNVVAHDENNQDADENQNREEQQYQLTEEENKNISTNLPAFLDDDNKKQQQKKEQQKQNKKQRKEQKQKQKQIKNQTDEKKQSNKSKLQKSKNPQAKQQPKLEEKDELNQNANEDENQKNKQKDKPQQSKIQKQQTVMQIHQQQYLKSIVTANKNIKQESKRQSMKDQRQQTKMSIMQQAFEISKILQEQLKSVLEPMDNAQYRGDYKTGKKLNLKKIIPFIASNYRKDKIWLRRTEPSQRNYYVMLALDDTKSMHHGQVGIEALKGLLAISLALQNLSIKTCVTGIRDSMNIHKSFQGLLEPEKIVNSFDFSHQSNVSHDLSIASFMEASLEEFRKSESSQTGIQNRQLCFIISDGKMNKDYVRPYLRQAKKRDIIYVFIVVDSEKASILTTKSVSIGENGKVKMKLYMSDFPFEYFLIVRNVRQLGDVLATTLLQFIQEK